MRRQQILLRTMSLLLLICILVYGGLRYFAVQKEKAAAGEVILEIPTTEIESISFAIEETAYTFIREDEKWICENDPDLKVNSIIMDVKLGYLEKLHAKAVIQSRDKLLDMGLETPVNTLTVQTAEKEYRIDFGDYNWMLTGYYIAYDGDVYLISASLYNAFNCTLDSITDAGTS